jgi:hypothetical protein
VLVPTRAWLAWLRDRPELAELWGIDPGLAVPKALGKSPLLLQPGEVLRAVFRRSPWFWVRRVALPAALGLILTVFCVLIPFPLGIFPLAGALLAWFLVGLFTWEWSVSVLAVTDRAVLVRQVDAWERRADFEKLALDRLREAVFRKQGLVDSVFGLVAVELEGDSAKGRLVFEGLHAGSLFLQVMNDLKEQRRKTATPRKAIRSALAARTRARQPALLWEGKLAADEVKPTANRLSWRTEAGNAVSFRRHGWRLVWQVLPWLTGTAVCGLMTIALSRAAPVFAAVITSLGVAASLLPLARAAYLVADWADDRLVLEGSKIVCLHRKPLWGGELRQEGELAQVQQAGVRKDSLAALVLDFGTVTVQLGGGTPLVFENAAHPEWVQAEIFHRRSQLQAEKERQEAVTRLDQMAEVFETWREADEAGYFAKDKPGT